MPKLIDYPRTSYTGAWEIAEITDDTGGKCSIETAARKLDRKVSGSFKAIIGSAVKFGLLTSKRDLLTTTTLFKRIKHAYDKQEELLFHREAFLTPPLFTQMCRKFRARELPLQMLDVVLIREFGVEEINAQGVAKAFIEGCRMVGLIDEHNIIADIDALAAKTPPRRELSSAQPAANIFRNQATHDLLQAKQEPDNNKAETPQILSSLNEITGNKTPTSMAETEGENPRFSNLQKSEPDAVASLFNLNSPDASSFLGTAEPVDSHQEAVNKPSLPENRESGLPTIGQELPVPTAFVTNPKAATYQIQVSGPGINTMLTINDEEDIALAIALVEKIRRQIKSSRDM